MKETDVAIVGMAGRFPGAPSVNHLWNLLLEGKEGISTFSKQELLESGRTRDEINQPGYVARAGVLADIDMFDASFFAYTPREAKHLDPQQRLFLETAYLAVVQAGYDPTSIRGPVGVFASSRINTYYLNHLHRPNALSIDRDMGLLLGNDKDFIATRVAYKLNLTGPAITVQTACSSSLVATHLACQSIIAGECDIALAGGAAICVPHTAGYLYVDGSILSPDGYCRPFGAKANGTVGSSGVACVLLKQAQQALADGDTIYGVIKGSAINNDGQQKVGFTAPGFTGQATVIEMAHQVADVNAETITYIEAHGTGTTLGDPIEVAALTEIFRKTTQKIAYCAIGSVKSNLGHLDVAAGVTALIKAALALHYKKIPPSLHAEELNPHIPFEGSPFFVNSTPHPWDTNGAPRRAGVSAFGVGGTNVHMIVEEAPNRASTDAARPPVVIPEDPFDRKSYWIEPPSPNHEDAQAEEDIGDWFYFLSWKQAQQPLSPPKATSKSGRCLIFTGNHALSTSLLAQLGQYYDSCILVRAGGGFQQLDEHNFIIRTAHREDYDQLASALLSKSDRLDSIVHMYSLDPTTSEEDEEGINNSLFSLIFLSQALWDAGLFSDTILNIISNDLHNVTGNEVINPATALLLGPCLVIPLEYPGVKCRNIDVERLDPDTTAAMGNQLADEITTPVEEAIVAFRGAHRWVRVYDRQYLSKPLERPVLIRDDGVYLITGGLGTIALSVAQYLAQTLKEPKLVLISRQASAAAAQLPTRDTLELIKNAGATVLVRDADVADKAVMEKLHQDIIQTLGSIQGVIHIAGVLGQGTIQNKAVEDVRKTLLAKTKGTQVLDEIIGDEPLDFFILFSSLSSISPVHGQVDYAAANAYLDAFAQRRNHQKSGLSLSINWGFWHERGLAQEAALPDPLRQQLEDELRPYAKQMTGVLLFERILNNVRSAQVIVSHQDLKHRMEIHLDMRNNATPSKFRTDAKNDTFSAYMKEIWADVFGLECIEPEDDFFDLGGDSITSIQLLGKIKKSLSIQLTLAELYDAPTLGAFTKLAENATKGQEATASVSHPALVTFNPEADSSKTPIYMFHPIGGAVAIYMQLAEKISLAPVFGLQFIPHDPSGKKFASTDDLAAYYATLIQQRHPDGPVILLGYSAGAFFAFETAQQLVKLGMEPERLIVVDQRLLNLPYKNKRSVLRATLDFFLTLPAKIWHETLHFRLFNWISTFRIYLHHFQSLMSGKGINQNEALFAMIGKRNESPYQEELFVLLREALENYRPSSYRGRVLLFRTPFCKVLSPREHTLGWSDISNHPVEVRMLHGHHDIAFNENNTSTMAPVIEQIAANKS